MGVAERKFHSPGRKNILDPEWDYDLPLADGPLHFASNLRRVVGVDGKDQHQYAASGDGLDNRFAIFRAGKDIPRRYPTTDSLRLKLCAGRVRDELILR